MSPGGREGQDTLIVLNSTNALPFPRHAPLADLSGPAVVTGTGNVRA